MYTVKQASLRTGVSVALLRQWERRYGVVHPARTPSGYRLYDDAAIARLRRMRALVDDGWSPSAAAAEVGAIGAAALPTEDHPVHDHLVRRFIDAAAVLDAPRMDAALDEMFERGAFEHVAERYLMPAIRAIGQAWADGSGDIAAEHAASHAILHRLGAAYRAAGRPTRSGRPVLVGLPPGARHELGALAFSVVARRAGMPTLYLGSDLPVQDWIDAVRQSAAVAAVIGVVSTAEVRTAVQVADALAAAHPEVRVAFGGGGVVEIAAIRTRGSYLLLPHGLATAVEALRNALPAQER